MVIESTRKFYLGLDLGQRRDYTALVVIEKEFKPYWGIDWITARLGETGTTRVMVRVIERIRLGTPYPEIIDWLRSIAVHPEMREGATLTVDATGVGVPVVDMIRAAKLGFRLVPMMITGGYGASFHNGVHSVPRSELLTNLQLMIQRKEFEIARSCTQAEVLQNELRHLQIDGKQTEHDDLAVALAMACWSLAKRY